MVEDSGVEGERASRFIVKVGKNLDVRTGALEDLKVELSKEFPGKKVHLKPITGPLKVGGEPSTWSDPSKFAEPPKKMGR